MKKYFISLTFWSVLQLPVFGQYTESQKLDSLRKQSSALNGKDKIDCLNLLARTIGTAGGPGYEKWDKKGDSIYYYASIAYREANQIDYKKGVAVALVNLSNSEWCKGIDLRINKKDDAGTLKSMESYLSRAIPLATQLQDYETLGYAYESWSDMVFAKSKSADPEVQAEYFKKAIDHFHLAGNDHKEGEDCLYHAERYMQRGFYDEAIEFLLRALDLNKKSLSNVSTKEEKEYCFYLYQQSLADIAELYKNAGDYKTAMGYIEQDFQFALANNTGWNLEEDKAEIFRLLGQYDSSLYYFNILRAKSPDNNWVKFGIATTFLNTNQYDSSLVWFQQVLTEFRKVNVNGRKLILPLLNIGSAYAGKNDYVTALPYVREGLGIALKLGVRPDVMTGYELLSRIHYHLGSSDSAYQYLLKYIALKDSIQNKQFIWRLNNFKREIESEKKQAQLMLLDKDNRLKTAQLRQESRQNNYLLILLSALSLAGIFVFRTIALKRKTDKLQREQLENQLQVQQLENEKKQAELLQQTAELEMQALRAQMNPHFIFNCLSSINRFILKNESKTASSYLTRFSRLMRMVLVHSQKPLISLDDELEMLKLYLEMERLRFKDAFDYAITFMNKVDSDNIFIPPLLLQPFCENAIWHGLMHLPAVRHGKDGPGRLDIELSMKDNTLQCVITDNGVGREMAAEFKSKTASKEKSMGLQITTERLALFNREKAVHTFYEIEDLKDEAGNAAGTRVILKISFKETVEENA